MPSETISEHYAIRILDRLARDGDRPVIRWREAVISAAHLHDSVARTAAALADAGVGQGGTVAILTGVNSPWMLTCRYATHLLGAAVVYVTGANHGTTTHGLSTTTRARMVAESGARVLLYDPENAAEAERIRTLAVSPVRLCALGTPESGSVSVDRRTVTTPETVPEARIPGRAMVLYTSGSTGQPKGVIKPFAAWNNVVLAESGDDVTPKHFLAVSAVSHTGGLLTDIAIASGGAVLLRESYEAGQFLRDIAEHRITDTLIGVPLLYGLLARPELPTADLSSLRRLLYVGCPASPERMKQAVGVFPGILNHSYGTTETGQIAMLTAADHDDPALLDSVGRPRRGLEVVIIDPESGRDLPAGELGEVVVRGPGNMEGYAADPELTAKVLRHGWIHTGDFGRLGEDGYLRLYGRISQMVKVHDTKVQPSEVEKVLIAHEGVIDAVVYPHRTPDLVEQLHAAVVLDANRPPSTESLREHVSRAMTPTHAPAEFVRWQEFPINANGKVDRAAVRERGASDSTLLRG